MVHTFWILIASAFGRCDLLYNTVGLLLQCSAPSLEVAQGLRFWQPEHQQVCISVGIAAAPACPVSPPPSPGTPPDFEYIWQASGSFYLCRSASTVFRWFSALHIGDKGLHKSQVRRVARLMSRRWGTAGLKMLQVAQTHLSQPFKKRR